MINLLTKFSVEKRWLIMMFTLLLAGLGLYNAQKLPMDAVPDITNVQVMINTEADGFTPLEVEQRITFLVETAMSGIPNIDFTRSLSRYGLSQVTVIFKEGTDIYWARQQISERLQQISLPQNLKPTLGPIASGLGEIFTYAVFAEEQARKPDGTSYSAEDLKTIQDWIIRPQMVQIPGITEINAVGGHERQYQVAPLPEKLLAFKVTLEQVMEVLYKNNQNLGAGYIEKNGEQWLVRSTGQLKTLEDIEHLTVAKRDDAPVMIKDVAKVSITNPLRTGAATLNGQETVLGTAFMLLGENSRTVAKAVASKLEEVNLSLPPGVVAEPLYNRTTLVDKTIATVEKNLFEGAVLVIVILFLFLGNVRAAIITALIIPLSMLFAISGMAANKVSGNLMSLGAIDFGLIVDGAVIVMENALLRLGQQQKKLGRLLSLQERFEVIINSTREVFQPAVFGVFIIILVYMPIFALSGVEGKMFEPMAFTVVAALIGALILTVTFIPAAIAIFVKGQIQHKENIIMRSIRRGYSPLLKIAIEAPIAVVVLASSIVVIAGMQVNKMGVEFMPQLDEHDIALHSLRITGTGLQQSVEMQHVLEKNIKKLPEVKYVFAKIGTPEVATDPMPPNIADTYLILKPKSEWPNPNKTKAEFISDLRQTITQVPGNNYEITQPIEMRFNELISGVRSDVAVRIYGDDLNALAEVGEQASQLLQGIAGGEDVRVESTEGLPLINIEPDREHLALIGLSIADVQQTVQLAINGQQTGWIYEGDRRFKLVLRLDNKYRLSPQTLEKLPIPIPNSGNQELKYVPLGEVAKVHITEGPSKINRQSGKRNIVITANVRDRDLGSYVEEVKSTIQSNLTLPSGYWIEYDGTYKQLQSAQERLAWIIPMVLLMIIGLLYNAFNSMKDALIIFTAIPLALSGGLFALELRDMPLSLSAMVGFIALSGIAVLNGVVLLSFIRQLRDKGEALLTSIEKGVSQRLRPVLMTALVASLGFIPMALNTGAGAEVQKPLATVVIGGIITSTLLTLVVLPALYQLVYSLSGNKKQT